MTNFEQNDARSESQKNQESPKKPYAKPELSEYGDLSKHTQGALVLSVVTPLTVTLADIAGG
jgi:hypothetical protein